MAHNIALGIAYQGQRYKGWQRQTAVSSVQAHVEAALSRVADHEITITCAGRTDSGVHATGQVVNFVTSAERPEKAWVLGTNTHLPSDIRVLWAKPVEEEFSARFSATARHYRYLIDQSQVSLPMFHGMLTHYPYRLDEQKMHRAAQCLLGEQDFSSFRSVDCQSNTPMRNMMHIQVWRKQQLVGIDIAANAFLHHMVRNIVGTLLPIGRAEKPVEWMQAVLAAKDRTQAGITAPAAGLYLVAVDYPDAYDLPQFLTPETETLWHELA